VFGEEEEPWGRTFHGSYIVLARVCRYLHVASRKRVESGQVSGVTMSFAGLTKMRQGIKI
jgi:hypothetical protein